MDNEAPFGLLLKRYRRVAQLSQLDLATRAGYSSHYVSMLERGVRLPAPVTVDLLAGALALSPAECASLRAAAAPAQAIPVTSSCLPVPPFPLIGREEETTELIRVMQQDGVRLVTVTGPGGVGKTSLAVHVAAAIRPDFADGAVFVDLSEVQRQDAIMPAIAHTLALRAEGHVSSSERVHTYLRERTLLLLLDSVERVPDVVLPLGDLLAGCPGIKLLLTSRIPVRLRAEHEFRVQPLALPPAGWEPGGDERYSALDLFLQRARLVKPGFVLDADNAAIIIEICRRLDGIPLAIELAAARLSHLPIATLRDRLDHRLQILTGGSRDLPDRQKRMRDTIAWSYELLEKPHAALLRRLSAFAGSWSLDAAEAVCAEIEPFGEVLDGLRVLVESSLVIALDDPLDDPRYRMLDTIREFALEAADAGELHATRRRHSDYYVRLGERAESALQDQDQDRWYALLEREQENLRITLEWLLQEDDGQGTLQLAGAVWRFWQRHGDIREGRRWLERALVRAPRAPETVRARALWGASWLAYYEGEYDRSRFLSQEHLALARAAGDARSVRNALTGLGMVSLAEGKYDGAVQSLGEALQACRPLGNIWHRATSALNLGHAVMMAGDLDAATALYDEALQLYQERRDESFAARARQHLGYVALLRGQYDRAAELFTDSLRPLGERGDRSGIADGLEGIAAARAANGGGADVARLLEGAAELRSEIGVPAFPSLRSVWEPFVAGAQERIDAVHWTAAQADGRATPWRDLIADLRNRAE